MGKESTSKKEFQQVLDKIHKEIWLRVELDFVRWLYKYKNFLGKLKPGDFKQFDSREEAWDAYINDLVHEARRNKYGKTNKKKA